MKSLGHIKYTLFQLFNTNIHCFGVRLKTIFYLPSIVSVQHLFAGHHLALAS